MKSMLERYEKIVRAGTNLGVDEAKICADIIFSAAPTEVEQVANLLQALAEKGETACEVLGFARAILERANPAPKKVIEVGVDLAGTGGSGLSRFNVSTAAAFVTAAAGAKVVKHGNRGSRQPNGCIDFLDGLKINYDLEPAKMEECFAKSNLAFFYARSWHPAMGSVAPSRKRVAGRTIFNLAAPLCNPANPLFQFMGTSNIKDAETVIEVLQRLGRRRALVVCGAPGIDDISVSGPTDIFELRDSTFKQYVFEPCHLDIERISYDQLPSGTGNDNAKIFHQIISDLESDSIFRPLANLVCVNAGAALYCAERVKSIEEGYKTAQRVLANSAVSRQIALYRAHSRG